MKSLRVQTAMRRRLRWPLPLAMGHCRGQSCARQLDALGDHAAACSRSGLLKLRSRPLEKIWVRILREGGARVRENVLLRDTGVAVDPSDGRNIEIVATGLQTAHGLPVAIDTTMVSPLHADGTPFAGAEAIAGVALRRAERHKRSTYSELAASPQLRLLTAGVEAGGRMSSESRKLIKELAVSRSQSELPFLRPSVARAFRNRWVIMASVAAQDALAATSDNDGVGF